MKKGTTMITSTGNDLIKLVGSLHHKKGRLEQNLYLAEGIHLVQEALRAGAQIRRYFWTNKLVFTTEGQLLLKALQACHEGYEVSETVFAKISETENPQGILAVITIPENPPLDLTDIKLGLIIDGLQDPGNVGTIIRTAWAAGLDGLVFTPLTADPYQGKVVRASMGGVFSQKIYRNAPPQMVAEQARRAGVQIVAGAPTAKQNIFEMNLLPPTLFLVGNEGQGIASIWKELSLQWVKIPQPGRAESLNVAVAAGILIYEAIRQHLQAKY
jgi:TrmH family RNA methyltransferase